MSIEIQSGHEPHNISMNCNGIEYTFFNGGLLSKYDTNTEISDCTIISC